MIKLSFVLDLERYEEKIFKIADLTELYDNYALKIRAVKEFIETINEFIVMPKHNLLHWFLMNKTDNYAALVFSTINDGKNYDILVKDVLLNKMLPIIIRNSNSDIVFDQFSGFYYVLNDAEGRRRFFITLTIYSVSSMQTSNRYISIPRLFNIRRN